MGLEESKITTDEAQSGLSHVECLLKTIHLRKVVGDIISADGGVISYLPGDGEAEWEPIVYDDGEGRKMIAFSPSGRRTGPRFGLETLRPFIETPFEIRSSKSYGSPKVNMLPYARFDENGNFAPKRSFVLLLSEEQCEDLKQLLLDN